MQHTLFLYLSLLFFARLQRETSRNFLVTRFMEEISYVFSFTFVCHCRLFSPLHRWPLAFLILSPPLQNLHVLLPIENVPFNFYLSLYISFALFLVEIRWPAANFSFSLSFSCSIFQICGHDN